MMSRWPVKDCNRMWSEWIFLSLTGVCEDAIQLNTLLKTQQPDLLLLDIEMPYLSGLDLLATLNQPPKSDRYFRL